MADNNDGNNGIDPNPAPITPVEIDGGSPVSTVPEKAYNEVKTDMLKYKQELRRKEHELEQANARAKELELAGLRAKEDYKSMYETEKQEREKYQGENKQIRQALVDDKKLTAMKIELQRLGLHDDAMKNVERLIDLDSVEVELTSTGRVNVLNAKDEAEKFKAANPYLFGSRQVNVNTNTPQVIAPGSVTMDQVRKLEEQWKKTRSPHDEAQYKKALLAMKGVAH